MTTKQAIKEDYVEYIATYNTKPAFAECIIEFAEDKKPEDYNGSVCVLQDPNNPEFELGENEDVVLVQLDTEVNEAYDEQIFFYFEDIEDLLYYCEPKEHQDFVIKHVNYFSDAF